MQNIKRKMMREKRQAGRKGDRKVRHGVCVCGGGGGGGGGRQAGPSSLLCSLCAWERMEEKKEGRDWMMKKGGIKEWKKESSNKKGDNGTREERKEESKGREGKEKVEKGRWRED